MYRHLQKIVLLAGLTFAGWLFYLASSGQKAVDSRKQLSLADTNLDEITSSSDDSSEQSQLELKEFNRVQVKDGKKIWEVTASGAKFFSEQGLTHIDQVKVEIVRQPQGLIKIKSDGARLDLEDDVMQRADLEGDIFVKVDDTLGLRAQFATFDSIGRKLLVPGKVRIYGSGYEMRGEGFEMNIDGEGFLLRENVRTKFLPGAKLPEGFSDLQS